MKKIVLFIMMMLPVAVFGQKSEDSITSFTEYRDGLLWKYSVKGNIIVGTTCYEFLDEYGKYYQLAIYIKNEGEDSFIFQPDGISAILKSTEDKTNPLLVYSYDQYMRKIQRRQNWSMALNSFAVGMNAGMAGQKRAYVSGWSPGTGIYSGMVSYYDSDAALSASIQGSIYLDHLKEKYSIDRKTKSSGYLRTNTIHSGEEILGYVNIKRKRGRSIEVIIPANGFKFDYRWNLDKSTRQQE